jgi:hypothetical protein
MGDDLEDQYERISTYKKRNYLVIPLGISEGKTVTIALPFDYDERIITAIMWTALDSIKNRSASGSDLWDLFTAEMPSLTNTINIPIKWSQYFSGQNPRDHQTGRDILTDTEFRAGGIESLKPMLKWTWNQVLGGIIKVNVREKYKDVSVVEKIANLPGINAFVSVEDYGLQEEINKEIKKIEKQQARDILKKDKIIIDHIREFYADGNDNNIDRFIGKAMAENFKGKTVSMSDETNFRKSFMREYFKTMNNSYISALIYANTTEEQAKAISIIKENAEPETFNKIKRLFLNARLISEDTWDKAMAEINRSKKEANTE